MKSDKNTIICISRLKYMYIYMYWLCSVIIVFNIWVKTLKLNIVLGDFEFMECRLIMLSNVVGVSIGVLQSPDSYFLKPYIFKLSRFLFSNHNCLFWEFTLAFLHYNSTAVFYHRCNGIYGFISFCIIMYIYS